MSRILELREKRAKAWEEAKNFLDTHRSEDGTLSAEDAAQYDRMEHAVVDLGHTIEREERAQTIENDMRAPVNEPVRSQPGRASGAAANTATAEYSEAFWNLMTGRAHLSEVRDALQVGTDSEGGYLVPDEFERRLISALDDVNVMRRLGTTIRTNSGDRIIPMIASRGEAAWTAEEAAYHESDMSFGEIRIGAHKATRVLKISEELLNDAAFDMQGIISAEFGRSFGILEEEAFLAGDGNGKPLGLLADTGGAQEGTAATALTFDAMFDLYYSLRAPYRGRAAWLVNDGAMKALRKIKDGNQQYIWQPSVTAGTPDTILGRPVYTSPYMPLAEGGKKGVVFGDFKYYYIADRGARTFKRLNELYATTGQVGFIANERVDAKLVLPEAVKYMTVGSAG